MGFTLMLAGVLMFSAAIDPIFNASNYVWTSEGPHPWYYGSRWTYISYTATLGGLFWFTAFLGWYLARRSHDRMALITTSIGLAFLIGQIWFTLSG